MKKVLLFAFFISLGPLQPVAYSFTLRKIINKNFYPVTLFFQYKRKTETIKLNGCETREVNILFPAYKSEKKLESFEKIWNWRGGKLLSRYLKVHIPIRGITVYAVEGETKGMPGAYVQYPDPPSNSPKELSILKYTVKIFERFQNNSCKDFYNLKIVTSKPYLELVG